MNTSRILQVKPHLKAAVVGVETVLVYGEREHYMIPGRAIAQVAPLVDGRRMVSEICAALKAIMPEEEVLQTLAMLENKGYLCDASSAGSSLAGAFWQALGLSADHVERRLSEFTVEVIALGRLDAGPMTDALRQMGISVGGDNVRLRLVMAEDYLSPKLDELNIRQLAEKVPWMLVKPAGIVPWIGPIFTPGSGPCWECLAHRLRANRPVETLIQRENGGAFPLPPSYGLACVEAMALNLAVINLAKWILREGDTPAKGTLLSLDVARNEISEHCVIRQPKCKACNPSPEGMSHRIKPVVLASVPLDGHHRPACEDSDMVYDRLKHHVSPVTGIISSLGPVQGMNKPHRAVYGANWLVCPTSTNPRSWVFHRTSLGKGENDGDARMSALGEAIERYTAAFQGDEMRRRASLMELGEEGIHPNCLMNFSADQFARRAEINTKARDRAQEVPCPYDANMPIDWTPVWSLTENRPRYVPSMICYYGMKIPDEQLFGYYDSNGDAAGGCLESAIARGFFEVVERDAVALWWYNRAVRPAVEVRSLEDDVCNKLVAQFESGGWKVWLLDVTTDLEIPVMVAYGQNADNTRFSIGFGCDFDPVQAARRALSEFNQLLEVSEKHPLPWAIKDITNPAYLFPSPVESARTKADFKVFAADDLRDVVLECVARASRVGMEMLVHDRTRPEVALNVVKVIVPGMRFLWPRLGPGRLYEVPPKLDWIGRQLSEQELNPVPLLV
jgi:bacteriocin biosynthesis cyclodehydratase domain-containing protein